MCDGGKANIQSKEKANVRAQSDEKGVYRLKTAAEETLVKSETDGKGAGGGKRSADTRAKEGCTRRSQIWPCMGRFAALIPAARLSRF